MSEWAVLGLSQHPAPGDPAQVRVTAARFAREADLLARAMSRVSGIAASSSELGMAGDYAAVFQTALDDLPGELAGVRCRTLTRCWCASPAHPW